MPVLKSKSAEFEALHTLLDDRTELCPLIEVVGASTPVEIPGQKSTPPRPPREHLEWVFENIAKRWGPVPIHVDFNYFFQQYGRITEGSRSTVDVVDEEFQGDETSPALIPVTGLDRTRLYDTTMLKLVNRHQQGMAIRVTRQQLQTSDLTAVIAEVLDLYGLPYEEVDLIVDLEYLQNGDVEAVGELTASILRTVNKLGFRRLMVVGGSYPSGSPAGMVAGSTTRLPRVEWSVWQSHESSFPKGTIFGDYGVDHPVFSGPGDGNPPTAWSNLRYTVDDDWVLVKGKPTRSMKIKGSTLPVPPNDKGLYFKEVCKIIHGSGLFYGADWSWGDTYIETKATAMPSAKGGAPRDWRKAMFSHHFITVLSQLVQGSAGGHDPEPRPPKDDSELPF